MKPTRTALTLLEVIISLSLFGVVMVAVLESLVSTTNYVEFDATRNDLTTATMQCQNRVINDFANAAWFYEYDPKEFRAYINPITKQRNALYPVVGPKNDTIEFLKLRSSMTIDDNPKNERYGYTNFHSANSTPVDFSHYVDAPPTPLMVMNKDYVADPQLFIAPVWETNQHQLNFEGNQTPSKLRHYMYVVEKNSSGTPCLVRKYINVPSSPAPASTAWNLDEVLMEGVSGVQFATNTEDPTTLNQNQIRITIQVHRDLARGTTGGTVDQRIEIIAAMRSINQDN